MIAGGRVYFEASIDDLVNVYGRLLFGFFDEEGYEEPPYNGPNQAVVVVVWVLVAIFVSGVIGVYCCYKRRKAAFMKELK